MGMGWGWGQIVVPMQARFAVRGTARYWCISLMTCIFIGLH